LAYGPSDTPGCPPLPARQRTTGTLAEEPGLDADALSGDDSAAVFAGNVVPEGAARSIKIGSTTPTPSRRLPRRRRHAKPSAGLEPVRKPLLCAALGAARQRASAACDLLYESAPPASPSAAATA
jgi:hypothetical protein